MPNFNNIDLLPGEIYLQGSLLLVGTYGDPRVLDAEVSGVQEAADLVYELAPEKWVYIMLPRKRRKQ